MSSRQRKQQQQQQQQQQAGALHKPDSHAPAAMEMKQSSAGSLLLQPLGLLCTGTTLMVLGQYINMQVTIWCSCIC
jgi:hypothetical protein